MHNQQTPMFDYIDVMSSRAFRKLSETVLRVRWDPNSQACTMGPRAQHRIQSLTLAKPAQRIDHRRRPACGIVHVCGRVPQGVGCGNRPPGSVGRQKTRSGVVFRKDSRPFSSQSRIPSLTPAKPLVVLLEILVDVQELCPIRKFQRRFLT